MKSRTQEPMPVGKFLTIKEVAKKLRVKSEEGKGTTFYLKVPKKVDNNVGVRVK